VNGALDQINFPLLLVVSALTPGTGRTSNEYSLGRSIGPKLLKAVRFCTVPHHGESLPIKVDKNTNI
jgi:hypothetical protein